MSEPTHKPVCCTRYLVIDEATGGRLGNTLYDTERQAQALVDRIGDARVICVEIREVVQP